MAGQSPLILTCIQDTLANYNSEEMSLTDMPGNINIRVQNLAVILGEERLHFGFIGFGVIMCLLLCTCVEINYHCLFCHRRTPLQAQALVPPRTQTYLYQAPSLAVMLHRLRVKTTRLAFYVSATFNEWLWINL